MMKTQRLVIAAVSLICAPLAKTEIANAQNINRVQTEILLQGFNWESAMRAGSSWYSVLDQTSTEIAQAGFTSIWLPPPSEAVPSVDQPFVPNVVDSRGYMPLRYYNLNSKYGSAAELKSLVATLKSKGINPVADIVINHRGAMNRDSWGRWNVFEGPVWGTWAITRDHRDLGGTGGPDTGAMYGFAADLDHQNVQVRRDLKEWMNWLKNDIGFEGWRYDFAKGYGGSFVGEYNISTSPNFSVGEFWTSLDYSCEGGRTCYNQDNHRKQIVNWIDSTWSGAGRTPELASAAFDFTTKGILQEALRTGEYWRLRDASSKAPGLIGWWPEKSVTFIDNHDTGSTQQHWPFGNFDQVLIGYVYILTHPGTPTVFWDHYFDWGMKYQLKRLMQIRRRNALSSSSALSIEAASPGLYAATIDGRVAMKLGSGAWQPRGNGWTLSLSGPDFAVWER